MKALTLIAGIITMFALIAVAIYCAVVWAKHQDPDGNY
jgi:hypothetical protein